MGVSVVVAVTANPGGAWETESPWLIHTPSVAGRSRSSVPFGSVTRSSVAPYSRRPVRSTRPPNAVAIA